MKKVFFITLLIVVFSCNSYIDVGKSWHSEYVDFIIKDAYNEYIYKSKIAGSNEDETFWPRNYKIKIPKGIISYTQIGNILYVEYRSKQIICVKAKYLNDNVKEEKWKLIGPEEETIVNMLSEYWEEKNYNFDRIHTRKNRITKLYTNGIFTILLYNIKKKNFDHFLNMVKSIEEIKYKTPDN